MVSDQTDRDNKMALSYVYSAIPGARLHSGQKLLIHGLFNSEALCGAGSPDKFFLKDEFWVDAVKETERITCPACLATIQRWRVDMEQTQRRYETSFKG